MSELKSFRFSGDSELNDVLNGRLRLGAIGTQPFPAPVLSNGPAIQKVQQTLIDIGYPLPVSGADGNFGSETGSAVVTFKTDWHLTPRDPVIGPKTMAALDKEMLALERPEPVVPPEPTPSPPDDLFARTPSGFAKIPAAIATISAFATNVAGSNWLHLNRTEVASGIIERINNPDGAQQGGNGLCTTAAFINVWAQDAPDAYALFATALFDNGAAFLAPNQTSGGLFIKASNSLLQADYSAIASRMNAKRLPAPSQADWMVMSAIRDSSNSVINFTGDPDDWVSNVLGDGASPFGDLDSWLRNAGAWVSVVEQTNLLLTASVDQAKLLEPIRSRCLLNIDIGMLINDSGRHTVVLRSPITDTGDGFVTLKIWSWAGIRDLKKTKTQFEETYFGANIAFF